MFNFRRGGSPGAEKSNDVPPERNDGLPDSARPSGLCPRCGKQSSFECLGSLPVTYEYSSYTIDRDGTKEHNQLERISALICRNCHQGTAIIEELWVGDSPWKMKKSGGLMSYRGVHWWPLPEARLSSDVPSDISEAFAEAARSLAANCPRAAAVMARRTLEAVTVDKGQTTGVLATRLANLAAAGNLYPSLADWAREVRLIGNTGGHFDLMESVSPDDARQLLDFLRELLKYLYELPADLNRLRNRESAPNTGGT